jgi:hypothetical protein
MCALDGVSTRSLPGFGFESFVVVRCTGFMNGDCPGNLSLGQHTVDGKYDGETFLGRTWMFFSGRNGGGKGDSRARAVETFSQDDTSSKQPWVYVIYYMLNGGGFCCSVVQLVQLVPRSSTDSTDQSLGV